ncbi:MAG TPA: OsmC family protein [Stellaceae bacterium]|jgi:putative redox protein|nr:OsmC family protein [Stellaceae bacterium]
MKASATWVNGRMFVGEAGSGHAVVMDGAPDAGGRNAGVRPMEMLLMGLAGCSAFDVVHILEKGRVAVTGCVVSVEAERAEADPKVFTRINLHFKVSGKNLVHDKVERAVQLSADKYCSASIMLGKTAEMSHTVEVVEN